MRPIRSTKLLVNVVAAALSNDPVVHEVRALTLFALEQYSPAASTSGSFCWMVHPPVTPDSVSLASAAGCRDRNLSLATVDRVCECVCHDLGSEYGISI